MYIKREMEYIHVHMKMKTPWVPNCSCYKIPLTFDSPNNYLPLPFYSPNNFTHVDRNYKQL